MPGKGWDNGLHDDEARLRAGRRIARRNRLLIAGVLIALVLSAGALIVALSRGDAPAVASSPGQPPPAGRQNVMRAVAKGDGFGGNVRTLQDDGTLTIKLEVSIDRGRFVSYLAGPHRQHRTFNIGLPGGAQQTLKLTAAELTGYTTLVVARGFRESGYQYAPILSVPLKALGPKTMRIEQGKAGSAVSAATRRGETTLKALASARLPRSANAHCSSQRPATPTGVTAQVTCHTKLGTATYRYFQTRTGRARYFARRVAATTSSRRLWGRCQSFTVRRGSTTKWGRKLPTGYQSGRVAFRVSGHRALVLWSYTHGDRHVMAETAASRAQRSTACRLWYSGA